MNISKLYLAGIHTVKGMNDEIAGVVNLLQQKLNIEGYAEDKPHVKINSTIALRLCLLAGLSDRSPRSVEDVQSVNMTIDGTPYVTTFYSKANIGRLFEALIKLRYHDVDAEWDSPRFVAKVMGREILRGRDMLLKEGTIDDWLLQEAVKEGNKNSDIPELNLHIGHYENGMDAYLDMNSRSIGNTQILVAGTTGSGKSNLLSVLISQIRNASSDTRFPVNFLLFDYKGEFSDPENAAWLQKFNTSSAAILNPMENPLPFTPFKDFTGRPVNEVNLYATSMATALSAISPARISANMDNRLSESIITAYKKRSFKPISFEDVLNEYAAQIGPDKQDSVSSVLSQLVRNNIFSKEDSVDLINDSHIINLGGFEKDGIMAKAIVYFVISKLNNIYEKLPKQAMNDERVELRHFTIIDEAHYMLGFENKPLQNLIAVGRNKGMSVILATQNMESYKSGYDFIQNAQYPLIMKQQQQNDSVLKDLFGVSGSSLQELKQAITGLQKGELITKDDASIALGLGKPWQKIKVTHLI